MNNGPEMKNFEAPVQQEIGADVANLDVKKIEDEIQKELGNITLAQ